MKKVVLIFLGIAVLFSSIFLVYNIINYEKIRNDNGLLSKEIKEQKKEFKANNETKTNNEKQLETLKNSSKEKINTYEKWDKWTNEIKEKIS